MKNTFPRMHVSLYVSDIEATVKFYSKFFGIEATKIKSDYAKFELMEPSLIISFVQNPDRVKDNFGHLGFQVETQEQLNEYLNKMQALQMPILEEKETACCYAVQDKFWVTDPDGVQWEVYYFHEDVEFNDPKYDNEEAQACCTPKKKLNLAELTPNSCC